MDNMHSQEWRAVSWWGRSPSITQQRWVTGNKSLDFSGVSFLRVQRSFFYRVGQNVRSGFPYGNPILLPWSPHLYSSVVKAEAGVLEKGKLRHILVNLD